MSEHLWMYEGVTEYFANLFKSIRINPEEEFYMAEKIENANFE
jgi:predicted metalloprotease with PDZ domain